MLIVLSNFSDNNVGVFLSLINYCLFVKTWSSKSHYGWLGRGIVSDFESKQKKTLYYNSYRRSFNVIEFVSGFAQIRYYNNHHRYWNNIGL